MHFPIMNHDIQNVTMRNANIFPRPFSFAMVVLNKNLSYTNKRKDTPPPHLLIEHLYPVIAFCCHGQHDIASLAMNSNYSRSQLVKYSNTSAHFSWAGAFLDVDSCLNIPGPPATQQILCSKTYTMFIPLVDFSEQKA